MDMLHQLASADRSADPQTSSACPSWIAGSIVEPMECMNICPCCSATKEAGAGCGIIRIAQARSGLSVLSACAWCARGVWVCLLKHVHLCSMQACRDLQICKIFVPNCLPRSDKLLLLFCCTAARHMLHVSCLGGALASCSIAGDISLRSMCVHWHRSHVVHCTCTHRIGRANAQ